MDRCGQIEFESAKNIPGKPKRHFQPLEHSSCFGEHLYGEFTLLTLALHGDCGCQEDAGFNGQCRLMTGG